MGIPRTLVVAAALALGLVPPLSAQQSRFGVHVGYNLDLDEALFGAQLHLPLGRGIEIYPSFDYYFVDESLVGFNVDLQVHGARRNPLYLGGGLNFLRASGRDTETGANLFVGLEARSGHTVPYVELRLLIQDDTSLQLLAGLSFTF